MAIATEAPPKSKTLVEKVNEALDAGDLDGSHGHHYKSIAKTLDQYETKVDKYTEDLIKKVGASHEVHKKPEDLYMAIIRHIAATEKIKNADKIENFDELDEDDVDKIRNHLEINYGIASEGDLRKLLDTVAGGEYKTEDEIREALRALAHRRGQREISKKAAAWTSDKEWPANAGKDGTHYKFMQLVSDHHTPEGARKEVDTFKTPEQAISYMGTVAEDAYRSKKEARRKV